MDIFIYTLTDPRNDKIRYVGKTNDLKGRYRAHCSSDYRKANLHRRNWVNSMKKDGVKPIMELLEVCDEFNWKECEVFWISQLKSWGFDLLNYTVGGDGCTFGNQTSFKKGHGAKAIVALTKQGEFVKEFSCCEEGEKFCGKKCVDNALNRKLRSAGGYLWFYEDVYKKMDENSLASFVEWANKPRKESSNKSGQFGNRETWNKGIGWSKEMKEKIGNKNKGKKPPNCIKIGKFDLNDNLLEVFDSIRMVILKGFTSINTYLDKNKIDKKGYKWKKIN